ncbi:MAG: murein biosynthesis integral membrane protein MurJ [Spirochaetales bacterium]|nr:murein biosynthesis integral membrane protein MurJ [Spirochaetales bacterium]
MAKEKKINKSSVFTLMFFTLGSRILGLLREMTKAHYLGDGIINDTFNVAFMIPNLLRRLFAESSMSVAFIPTFKGVLKKNNESETKDFLNAIFTTLSFLVTISVILGILLTPLFVKVIDTKNADINELILLTRIMFPYLGFISLAALFQGILNSLNIFGPGSFVPILYNIVTILTTIFLSKYTSNPARAMSIGVVIGGFLQMSFQLPYIFKNGYKFKFTSIIKSFKNPETKKVGRLIAPTLASMGAYQLSSAVATTIAFNTGVGVSSALSFSLRLQELVLGIFAVSIGTILISTLSKAAKDEDWERFNLNIKTSLNAIALITIPVTVFAFIHAEQIVELIFKGGAFGENGVILTASVFKIHISGLYFIAITRIIAPAFFSLEDSKTPAMLGIVSVLIGVGLMFLLAPIFKAQGIAFATIASSLILAISYFIFLRKKKDIDFIHILKETIPASFRILVFSLISAYPIIKIKLYIFTHVDMGNKIVNIGLPLVISTLLYFGIYFIFLIIFKEKCVKELNALARKR